LQERILPLSPSGYNACPESKQQQRTNAGNVPADQHARAALGCFQPPKVASGLGKRSENQRQGRGHTTKPSVWVTQLDWRFQFVLPRQLVLLSAEQQAQHTQQISNRIYQTKKSHHVEKAPTRRF